MQNMMLMSLLCSLPAGAMAGKCKTAYVWKDSLSTVKCEKNVNDANCQTKCCKKDKDKCVNYGPSSTIGAAECADDKYNMMDITGEIGNKAVTDLASSTTDCCVAKKTCADLTACTVAGYKKDTTKDATKCPSDAKSCDSATSTCCIKDVTKCGGQASITCASGKYTPSKPAAVIVGVVDAATTAYNTWAAKVGTDAAACCETATTCAASTNTCLAGMKKETTGNCPLSDPTCKTFGCCAADTDKCGGKIATCTTGVKAETDAWKNTAATPDFDTACCKTAPACTAVTCEAGKTKKASPAATCEDQSATHRSCSSNCCEADLKTCGGLRSGDDGKSCDDTSYYFENAGTATSSAATAAQLAAYDVLQKKASTATTFQADCCTKKATCDVFKTWVSTALVAGAQQVHPGLFIVLVGLSVFASLWKP